MRTIKFRGYSKDFAENEWFFGNLIDKGNGSFQILEKNPKIWDLSYDGIEVLPESIGQFTGLHDKNGKEIYEGDIVNWGMHHQNSEEHFHRYAIVEFNPDIQFKIIFYINSQNGNRKETDGHIFRFGQFAYKETNKHLEVIGNIYENPELL